MYDSNDNSKFLWIFYQSVVSVNLWQRFLFASTSEETDDTFFVYFDNIFMIMEWVIHIHTHTHGTKWYSSKRFALFGTPINFFFCSTIFFFFVFLVFFLTFLLFFFLFESLRYVFACRCQKCYKLEHAFENRVKAMTRYGAQNKVKTTTVNCVGTNKNATSTQNRGLHFVIQHSWSKCDPILYKNTTNQTNYNTEKCRIFFFHLFFFIYIELTCIFASLDTFPCDSIFGSNNVFVTYYCDDVFFS